jgi:hypothetical protein
MKRIVTVVALSALAAAVPAQARPGDSGARADRAPSQERGDKAKAKASKGSSKSRRCKPRRVAYVAHGLYVSSELTQVAGADTPALRDDRWDGTIVVDVKRTNKMGRADKGTQKTYTVAGLRIRFADRDDDGTRDQPVAGDRVKVAGKVTQLRRGCDTSEFESELKVKEVKFLPPPDADDAPAPPPPAPAPAP